MADANEVRAPAARTGVRLGNALSMYMLGVTLIVTLLPFQFTWPGEWRVMIEWDPFDIATNVLLFVPLGFLYRVTMPRESRGSVLKVMALGALVSVAIESAQLFEAGRAPGVDDVIANALGAGLGAAAFDRIARSAAATGRAIGWLSLELPLMALVYLLVPLLWVSSLAAGPDVVRALTTLVIGVFGAAVLSGIQRYYFGPAGLARPEHTAAFTGIWFLAGGFPLLASHPVVFLAGALGLSVFAWFLGQRGAPDTENRRFEVPLLKTAAPVYAAYLVLAVVVPLLGGTAEPGRVVLSEADSNRIEILHLFELAVAFAVAGYMAAQFRGRLENAYRETLPRLLAWGAALALAAQATSGFNEGYGAFALRAGLLIAATLYGGWLYHLQREHVVGLVRARATLPKRDVA